MVAGRLQAVTCAAIRTRLQHPLNRDPMQIDRVLLTVSGQGQNLLMKGSALLRAVSLQHPPEHPARRHENKFATTGPSPGVNHSLHRKATWVATREPSTGRMIWLIKKHGLLRSRHSLRRQVVSLFRFRTTGATRCAFPNPSPLAGACYNERCS